MRHYMIKKKIQKEMDTRIIILFFVDTCMGNLCTDLLSVHHNTVGWVVAVVAAWGEGDALPVDL